MSRNKSNKWCVRFLWRKQQNLIEGGKKQGFTIFMDGQVQYFKDCNFLQFTYKFNMISIKISVAFFKELDKDKLKNCKRQGAGMRLQKKEEEKNGGGEAYPFEYWHSLYSKVT